MDIGRERLTVSHTLDFRHTTRNAGAPDKPTGRETEDAGQQSARAREPRAGRSRLTRSSHAV